VIANVWQRVARRLARLHQRRRMARAASRPGELAARVERARTIVFVCHGNIIRSAFAAELLRARSVGQTDLRIRSAGLEAATDNPAHPTAVQCAGRFGIGLSEHRTHRLGRRDVEEADLLLAMEIDHVVEIHRRFPQSRHKVFLFGCLTDEKPRDVTDPVFSPREAFEACFERIDTGVRRIVAMLPPPARPAVRIGEAD
jgi:protein-tyrosine-phosphatase